MSFRDYEWYMKRYDEVKRQVAQLQKRITELVEGGDYYLASWQAESLVMALETLNDIANKAAEKMPD